ncbi:MAG: hypothetical protein PHN84_15665, partial [Desulfuromonadaceae bacterium]|nr:hypothetical protein [Desulfuromonadaceae bacterium]
SIRAIKKAAPKKAAQYLFRWGGFKLVFDFIAFFLPRSGLVQQVFSTMQNGFLSLWILIGCSLKMKGRALGTFRVERGEVW